MGGMNDGVYINTGKMAVASGPCRTPGAVYEIKLRSKGLSLEIMFPRSVLGELSSNERNTLVRAIHDAALPVIEKLYARTWHELFAGKRLAGHPGKMPPQHDDL